MNTLVRRAVPCTLAGPGGSCLLLILLGLPALRAQTPGESDGARVNRPKPADSKVPSPDRSKGDQPRSIELYRTHCMECHETDGRGELSRELMRTMPDFTKPEWHDSRDDGQLLRSIREGKGFMPSMKRKLEPTDTVLLVSLIRSFRGGGKVIPEEPEAPEKYAVGPGSPRSTAGGARASQRVSLVASGPASPGLNAGRTLFQRSCVSCHGGDGRGSTVRARVPEAPDFTSPDWQRKRSDTQLTLSILEGKGTSMPAFGGRLGDSQARELVAYLRSFAPTETGLTPKPTTDFSRRFRELRDEMAELKRQYRVLSAR